jgi:hypothetical protein
MKPNRDALKLLPKELQCHVIQKEEIQIQKGTWHKKQ